MVKLEVNIIHDGGDIPQTIEWNVYGIGKNNYIDIYVDDVLVIGQKGNNAGNIVESYTIPVGNRATFQNIYTLIIEGCSIGTVIGRTIIDGSVVEFRRRV